MARIVSGGRSPGCDSGLRLVWDALVTDLDFRMN